MSSNAEYFKTLQRLPLFNDLSDEELALVAENLTRRQFRAGETIFDEGDLCKELLIVEEGEVRVVKLAADGRRQLLNIERRGSSLSEISVFDGGTYPASAEAATSTTLLGLPAERFRRICVSNPEMALKLFKVLARKLRHLVGLVESLSFSTVRVRLISYLIRLALQDGETTSRGIRFDLAENNEELAANLGTVRELVSRNLGRLHGEGLIEMHKRIVTIRDMAALQDEIMSVGR